MKKIIFIRNAYSFDFGGGERVPVSIANEVSKYDFEPIIISKNPKLLDFAKNSRVKTIKGVWWSQQDWSGYKIIFTPIYFSWLFFVFLWYVLIFLKNNPKIVHVQSKDDFIAATLAGKLLGKKVIWSDHADLKHIYKNYQIWYKNPVGKLIYLVSLLANHIIITSKSEKQLIEDSLGKKLAKNYVVIYLGVVDTEQHQPKRKISNKVTIVATSRLVKDKGIGELIDAFSEAKIPNSTLKICGDGRDSKFFETKAKNAENIKFLGHIKDVVYELNKADIYIHPTYHESFGVSLVEAEMCGLPIIASDVGSIPEIVKDKKNGILVPVKDVTGLVQAIQKLVNFPELRVKMGNEGRQLFLDKFQLDKIVKEKYLPIYEK